jgi:hypothetical protein
MIGHAFMECIVARTIERRVMPAPENLATGLWPSKIDEIIDLMPPTNETGKPAAVDI